MRAVTLLLLLPILAAPAHAQTCSTEWASAVDGAWTDGANWTNGAPTSGSVACITVSGTYTVSLTDNTSLNGLVVGGESGTQTLTTRAEVSFSGDAHVRPNGRLELINRTPGGADGIYLPNGTLLVDGEVVVPGGVSFLSTGGTLDVAPDGVLRLVNDGGSGARLGDPSATFGIRGLLEADCGSATCQINAPLDLGDGTIGVTTGRLDVRAGGTLRDLALDVAESATLYFSDAADANIFEYVLEGIVSGEPAGDVYWSQTEVAAGPANVTLALGGSGFQLVGVGGSFLTSAGGDFLNTGLLTRPSSTSNFSGIDGATVQNEGRIEILNGLALRNGAEIRNEVSGVIAFTGSGSVGSTSEEGQLISRGLIVVEPSATSMSSIRVPVDLADSEIRLEAMRLDFSAGGTLRDLSLAVAEGAQLNFAGGGSTYTVEGTLSGEPIGTVYASAADFAAGTAGATTAVGGTGLQLSGSATLTSAGGGWTNTGLLVHALTTSNFASIEAATLSNEGRFLIDRSGFGFRDGAVVRNESGGVVEFSGGAGMGGVGGSNGRFENAGLLLKTGPTGTSSFSAELFSEAGAEYRVLTGRLDLPSGEQILPEGTTVTGTSQVRLISGLTVGGTISPGTAEQPIDTQEFVSSFKLGPTARLVLDVDGDGQSDRIIPASGQTNTLLGGTLVVRPRPGFTPSPGDEWIIFLRSANPYDILGEFDAIEVEGEVPEGVGFVIEKPNAGVVVLRAVSGVTIMALDEGTSEDGAPIRFVIRSSQPVPTGSALEVPLAFEGTATRYLDYVVDIAGSAARIPAGETETTVTLFPLRDDLDEGAETITLRILPDGDADPGDPDAATITLEDGPPTSALSVGGIAPSRGGANGLVSASVFGHGFAEDAQVNLVHNGTTVTGTDVAVEPSGRGLSARFDLTGVPAGTYDVVVSAGGQESTLPNGFTVEPNRIADIWADINGTPNPRNLRWSTYTLTVGNSGNADVHDTVVLLRVTAGVEIELPGGLELDIGVPEAEAYRVLDAGTAQLIPLYIYRLRAGEVGTFDVRIRPVPPVGIGSGAGVSYELYPPSPEAAFTWTGEVADFEQDQAAGIITNWGLMGGALVWAIEQNDPSHDGPGSTSGLRDGDLDNSFPRPDPGVTDDDLIAYNTAGFFNNNLTEIEANAPSFTGEFGGFLIGGLFVGVGFVVGSVPILVASGIAVVASAASTFHKASRSSRNVMCLRGRPCPPGGSGSGNGGNGNGGNGTGGPGGGPDGGIGGSAGGKVGGSVDPNDKLGPAGATEVRYLTADAPAFYTIRYENVETATFPAQEVVIVDDLDTSVYDLSTFSLGPITLPDRVITPPPGVQSFTTTVDLAPDLPAVLLINAALNPATGRVSWTFTTLDPDTNDLPEDGMVGFLPPNVEQPEGEGAVAFRIEMLPDLATNTDVTNLAEIVFDLNEPIVTPVWSNRIDHDAPASSVQPIEPSDEWPVTITVGGSDIGSGIHTYSLFVAEGDGPFEFYATSAEPVFEFEGEENTAYGFYSIAADYVFNFEPPKDEAEATFALGVSNEDDPSLPREVTFDAPYPNPASHAATLRWGLPEAGHVTVRVYDLLGREVARLADGDAHEAGWHTTRWDAGLASGTYFVRLNAATARESKTLVQRLVIVR